LVKAGAPVDDFGVGTQMGSSADAPSLDVIYKIAEVTNEEGAFIPTMKLSSKKVTVPGRKQVYRVKDKKGRYMRDVIGLEGEDLGEPLLMKVMQAGEIATPLKPLKEIQAEALKNLGLLKAGYKELHGALSYPVSLSPRLKQLMKDLVRDLRRRQTGTLKKS
jgi:nicotinate phosphoribosyltransferase